MGFFCGACSTAALPSCPPVQPLRAAVKTKIAPTITSPRRILILFSNSKGYAADSFHFILSAGGPKGRERRISGVAARFLQRALNPAKRRDSLQTPIASFDRSWRLPHALAL